MREAKVKDNNGELVAACTTLVHKLQEAGIGVYHVKVGAPLKRTMKVLTKIKQAK